MTNGKDSVRYTDFGIGEFISDPFFQDWVIHPDAESTIFWEEWTRQHPEKASMIEEARRFLETLGFAEDIPNETQVQTSFTTAMDAIRNGRVRGMKRGLIVKRGLGGMAWRIAATGMAWRIAAAFIGLVLCIALYYSMRERLAPERAYVTRYGEIRTLYLPDSSKLVLNAHSGVHYNKDWKAGQAREVWLDGEAFFDVRSSTASAFLVYTKELRVEVLGTAFDIRERRGRTEIVLQSGKIRVRFIQQGHEDLLMGPGDKIIYDPGKASLVHTSTIPENYTSWKDKKLTDVTVGQIVEYIEDNFNRKVILEDESMAERKIGGAVLLDNLDDAMFALSTVLNVNVIRQNDTLILRPRQVRH